MNWKVKIEVTLKKSVLDPQGVAVVKALHALNYNNTKDIRVGRHLALTIEDAEKEAAAEQVHQMCRRLLTNPVIEDYQFTIMEAEE